MADDITKKVLVDIQIKSEQAKKELPALVDTIEQYKIEIKALQAANKDLEKQELNNTEAYRKNNAQIIEKQRSMRQLKVDVREANKTIDLTTKAIYAENNSIEQNRALLSLLTAQHVKLGQANGNTKKQVEASATTIRNLTEVLKEQEKQIGQTYRNVGNYTDSIISAAKELNLSAIPGFQQLSTAMSVATKVGGFLPTAFASAGKGITALAGNVRTAGNEISNFVGFKQFNTQAAETESTAADAGEQILEMATAETEAGAAAEGASGGFTAMGVAVTAATAVIAGLLAAGYALVSYLKTLDSVGDTIEQRFAGIKASFYAAAESIRAGDWSGLALNMGNAKEAAELLTGALQDLQDVMVGQEVHNMSAEMQINDLMLKMRNKRTTPEQEQQYFNDIQKISTDNYKQRKEQADELYNLTIAEVTNGKYLTDEEKKNLIKRGTDYAIYLENQDKISVGSYKKIADAQKARIAADQFYMSVRERAQNRLDAKLTASEQLEAANAKKAEQRRTAEAAALLEAEIVRNASGRRMLNLIYEEYGDKVLAAEQSTATEMDKLNKLLAKKLITQQEYNKVSQQLTKENAAQIAKIIDDFNKKDLQAYQNAVNELTNNKIAGIDNETERTINALEQRAKEQGLAIDRDNENRTDNIKALNIEIAALDGKAKAEAEERRLNEQAMIQVNEKKRYQIITQTDKDILKAKRQAARDMQAAEDEADVLKNKRGSGVFNSGGAQSAELKAVTDRYNFEISEAARAGKSTVLLEQQKIDAIKAINDQYRNERIDYAVQVEQVIQGAAFDIISQGLEQQSQAILNNLDKRKSKELENTSLTGTQKKLIDAKYEKLEQAEKIRAFKANQKLQAANITINGAVGISKTIAEMGFLPALPFVGIIAAQTAASIAKVLTAKPGFAKGGQFTSDGKGALLSGYSRTDNTNAYLRSGEAVVVSEAMRVPWARNAVSRINEMFGGRSFATGVSGSKPGFFSGGIYTDGGQASRYYSQPVYDAEGLANSLAYQMINNMPPIIVDVKDVNNQQGILANTENRVNL